MINDKVKVAMQFKCLIGFISKTEIWNYESSVFH